MKKNKITLNIGEEATALMKNSAKWRALFRELELSRVFNCYHFGQTETERIQEGNFTRKQ